MLLPPNLPILLMIMVSLEVPVLQAAKYDYCKEKCRNPEIEQAACKCQYGPDCLIPDKIDWPAWRRAILDIHNALRDQFAKAAAEAEKKAGFKGAANVMAMSYDYDLEYTARCHAKKCVFGHHCGITQQFGQAGQNLYVSSEKDTDVSKIAKDTINFWYNEIANMNEAAAKQASDNFQTSKMPHETTGHFTQVAWAGTTSVGCWFTHGKITEFVDAQQKKTKPMPQDFQLMVTCNYGPPGNFQGQKMFEEGEAASKCPSGASKNSKYTGLCGEDSLPPPPFPKSKYGYDDPPDSAAPPRALSAVCAFLIVALNFGQILDYL